MLRFVKISILFMTIAIVILSSLIVQKLFTSPSATSNTDEPIVLALKNENKVYKIQFTETEIGIITTSSDVFIYNRETGNLVSHYKIETKQ